MRAVIVGELFKIGEEAHSIALKGVIAPNLSFFGGAYDLRANRFLPGTQPRAVTGSLTSRISVAAGGGAGGFGGGRLIPAFIPSFMPPLFHHLFQPAGRLDGDD